MAMKRIQKRKRVETQRFGATESSLNHNSFFEKLTETTNEKSASMDQVEICPQEECGLVSQVECDNTAIPSTSECIADNCAAQLKLLIAKVNAIQDQLIRLETMAINTQREQNESNVIGIIDIEKLKNFGLPVKNSSQLDELEEKLKDEAQREEIVGFLFIFQNIFHVLCSF